MKNFLVMVVAAIMASMSVNAQVANNVYYRVQVGANLSTLTGSDFAKYKVGWTVNTGFDFSFTNNFALGLDIIHDYIGAKSKVLDENVNLDYLGFGALARYYVTPWVGFYAGPEINFLTSAKVEDRGINSACKKTEFTVPLGVTFEPEIGRSISLVIDFRYRLGLSKVNKDSFLGVDGVDKLRNSAFILTLGVKRPF